MKSAPVTRVLAAAVALAFLAAPISSWSQAPTAAPVSATQAAAPASQQDLDRLLAPIALYPDSLLAQVLMASTHPVEVVMAARWSKANPSVTGKALEDAMQAQSWDASVKSLTAVPTVLERMSENVEWMHKLGNAFVANQKNVLDTVQTLRGKAQVAGNLKSTPEQTVRTETKESKQVIIIEPAQPEVVYVPTYDPAYVYGPWWYGYPPYAMYPPGYYYGTGMWFAAGVIVGGAIWGNVNWGGNNVHIEHHNNFNRANVGNGNRDHVDHRKNVASGDRSVAQRFDGARGSGFGDSSRASTTRGAMSHGSMGRGGGGRGGRR